MWGRSGCNICHRIDFQGWLGWSGWWGGRPLPPCASLPKLHAQSKRTTFLDRGGQIFVPQSRGIWVAALPCYNLQTSSQGMDFSDFNPDPPSQKLWGWGHTVCILTSLPDDRNALSTMRLTVRGSVTQACRDVLSGLKSRELSTLLLCLHRDGYLSDVQANLE